VTKLYVGNLSYSMTDESLLQLVGLTLGHSILVVRGHLGPRLLSHELRHAYQYEAHRSIAAFLPVYLEQIATAGYHNAPFEDDARAHEVDA
jgi:hypothetical protein